MFARRRFFWSKPSGVLLSPKPISATCINTVSAFPETMSWPRVGCIRLPNRATRRDILLGLLFDKGYGVPQDWVEAEVWLNLAAAHAGTRQQDYFARFRDAVAQKLTLNQLAEAQRRASAWAPIASRSLGPLSARY
jgi:hypothetical protein